MEKFVESPELDDLAVTRGLGHRAYVALLLQQAFVNSRWPGTGLIDYCFFHSQAKEVGETLLESFWNPAVLSSSGSASCPLNQNMQDERL